LDAETGNYNIGVRQNDPKLGIWTSTEPKWQDYPQWSGYVLNGNNQVMYIDKDGRRPLPLDNPYNKWFVKVDSWYGPRNTGLAGASTNHKGIDFNYSGGGDSDYGTPILATHEGTVTTKDNTNGNGGRTVYVTSPDGTFRTAYFHLSEINVENGQYVSESDVIAKMGGSAYGNEHGRTAHLHYAIQELKNGKWEFINPTGGRNNSLSNIIDPQKWITPDNRSYNGGELSEVTVVAPSPIKPPPVPLLRVEQPNIP
jgi:RHS repeat-associated protein